MVKRHRMVFVRWICMVKRLIVIVLALGALNVPANAAALSPSPMMPRVDRFWSSIPRQRSSSTPKGAIW